MRKVAVILNILSLFIISSCAKKNDYEINLKWNKAYPEDTFEKSITGLKWGLSFLGSSVANDSTLISFNPKDSIISININELGFSKNAIAEIKKLQSIFKQTEYYKKNNAFDLGRYISIIFGNSHNYYAITQVPVNLKDFKRLYNFSRAKGYINNSSISNVNRIITFSDIREKNKQAFISAEIDSITNDTLEYETVEIMPNGQLKFGIYDLNGNLKAAASSSVTEAGKPAKCIWCHEVVIQPLFKIQQSFNGYLSYAKFNDTLVYFNTKLQKYQNHLWKDKDITNKRLHTELEILYIAFMEANIERISREWDMPLTKVKDKLSGLKTHTYEEFPFLGELYHRKDIDSLAPYKTLKTPKSIRELSYLN